MVHVITVVYSRVFNPFPSSTGCKWLLQSNSRPWCQGELLNKYLIGMLLPVTIYFNGLILIIFHCCSRKDTEGAIFTAITFSNCHLPGKCQLSPGFVRDPCSFAFLSRGLTTLPLVEFFLALHPIRVTNQWPETAIQNKVKALLLSLCL